MRDKFYEALDKITNEILTMDQKTFDKIIETHKNGEYAKTLKDISFLLKEDIYEFGKPHISVSFDSPKIAQNINDEYYTVNSKTNRVTCRLGARRSIKDIYLVVKYYFPEITFEQVLEDIVRLYNEQFINGSFCNDVRFYVFYPEVVSSARNPEKILENSQEITFKDLINYFNNK